MWWAWENAHFFHYCDQSAIIYLNWYLTYQTIDYDRVSLIILSRSTWLHIKSIFDGTNQWASLHELRKKKLVFIPHAFRLTIVNFIKEFTGRVNKLAHIKIVNKLSLYYWSQWKEFARCAYGVIHAWHFGPYMNEYICDPFEGDRFCVNIWSLNTLNPRPRYVSSLQRS